MEKERVITLQKNADKEKNRVIIPKSFIDKWGNRFYMEVHEDKIVLIPIKKKGA